MIVSYNCLLGRLGLNMWRWWGTVSEIRVELAGDSKVFEIRVDLVKDSKFLV